MKSTGVIRRIDELGRIVIPKEIRKNLRINNNVSLELFIEDDKIILKKYSILKSIKDIAQSLSDVLYSSLNHNIIITDLFNVLAVSGSNKKYLNKDISNSIEDSIRRREKIFENYEKDSTRILSCHRRNNTGSQPLQGNWRGKSHSFQPERSRAH